MDLKVLTCKERTDMKLTKAFSYKIGLAGLAILFSNHLSAQQPTQGAATQTATAPATPPAAQESGHLIAVVDISEIFKKHPRFSGMIKQLQADADAAEAQLKNEFLEMEKTAKALDPKSPNARDMQNQLARRKMEFDLRRTNAGKELQDRESKLMLAFYKEITAKINEVVVQNNIAMVYRYNNVTVTSGDANDIMRIIGKPVLYADPRWDITQAVLSSIPAVATAPVNMQQRR
jgi:Skp family chaperone for outer membrane proteins